MGIASKIVKKIVILAGPNGAGKTTFAREFLLREADCPIFVNADLIANGLSPFQQEASAVRAGRIMLEEIHAHARAGRSFAFETTLSGRLYARRIPSWRRQGYRVKLIYLRLASADLAIARVRARILQGGHRLLDEVIVRRFAAGWRNFDRVYKPLVDACFVRQFRRRPRADRGRRKTMRASRLAVTDPDLANALPALKRAAAAARRLSVETGTPFYVMQDGRVVDLNASRGKPAAKIARRNGRSRVAAR